MKAQRLKLASQWVRDWPKWKQCKTFAIQADGSRKEIRAAAVFVDMGGEKDILIQLRRGGKGICAFVVCASGKYPGNLVVRPGASNQVYIDMEPFK